MEPTTRVKRVTAAVAYWPPITQQGGCMEQGITAPGPEPIIERDAEY